MKQAGFTLLELLVGLVVLGFILAGLSQASRYGLRAADTQARLDNGRSELDAVDRTLRRLVAQAEPGNTHAGPPLAGTPAQMTFISALPEAVGGAVSREAAITLAVDSAHRLVLRWTPYLHAKRLAPPPAPHDEELLRGIARLELAYWRAGWQPSWDGAALPPLVRIRLLFPPGDPRHWPDLVVASMRQQPE